MSRRIEDLHPSFQPIVREVLRRANERGRYPFITEGRREPSYQACLYAQGRFPIGSSRDVADLRVHVSLSADKKSVIVKCGTSSNVVPRKKWSSVVTQVGPYSSWHTLGLAVDFSFRSTATSRDDLIGDLEEAARAARAAGDTQRASKFYALIDAKFTELCDIWNDVAPSAIWGNDWDDDGIMNRPDPDNEWSDLPHFEWHPGLSRITRMTEDERESVIRGAIPKMPAQYANVPADPKCAGVI